MSTEQQEIRKRLVDAPEIEAFNADAVMRYQDEMAEACVFLWGEKGCEPDREEVVEVLRKTPVEDKHVNFYCNLIFETWGSYMSLYVYIREGTLRIHRVMGK